VVADLPFSSPVFARTNAPVQTDMVTSVVFEDFLIHSNTPGSVTLRGNDNHLRRWGVLNRVIGNDLHSAAGADRFLRFGHRVQAEGISSLLGIMTSWKTSHGPQKSITTAPSEIRKATGIWPLSGGFSEVVSVATAVDSNGCLVLTGAPVANNALSASTLSASSRPNRATWQTTLFYSWYVHS
jgi:hypothetical protein